MARVTENSEAQFQNGAKDISLMKLTIFIMNAVQSPVFFAFCSRADKVGLRFFCFVHDPATKSSKFPSVRWFRKRLGLDSWPAIQ